MEHLLLELLCRLEAIGDSDESLYDTVVREKMGKAIFFGFVKPQPGFVLPDDYGMPKEENQAVKAALKAYIEALRRLIPFLREPVDFLTSVEAMRRESAGSLADEPRFAKVFHMARGSRSAEPVSLPWLDVELSVFVAVNRFPGDDLAIALDYLANATDPPTRVW
jgi:hypothetical protein